MTDGYSSWWRVGDTEVSERKENLAYMPTCRLT